MGRVRIVVRIVVRGVGIVCVGTHGMNALGDQWEGWA
jgi:hypothetical protein